MSKRECSTSNEIVSGTKFGRWTVVDAAFRKNERFVAWCRCECGQERPVRYEKLRNGSSQSCGCFQRELLTTHGLTASAIRRDSHEYWIWNTMVQRCTNPRTRNFGDYGGRGIRVCERWRSFENFYADMGKRPSLGHSLERRDNNGNYDANNCEWVVRTIQARNKRNNRMISARGETRCLQEWAEMLGVSHATIIYRIRSGWTDEAAVTTPKNGAYAVRTPTTKSSMLAL